MNFKQKININLLKVNNMWVHSIFCSRINENKYTWCIIFVAFILNSLTIRKENVKLILRQDVVKYVFIFTFFYFFISTTTTSTMLCDLTHVCKKESNSQRHNTRERYSSSCMKFPRLTNWRLQTSNKSVLLEHIINFYFILFH